MILVRLAMTTLALVGVVSGFASHKPFGYRVQATQRTSRSYLSMGAVDTSDIKPLAARKNMQILIIGGGIGGMAMALSLHEAGFTNVDVYEQTKEIEELGVGINMQPSAIKEMIEMGLGDALATTGIATAEIRYFNKFGQSIFSEPRGIAAGYMWPQYSIHRGKLLMLLFEAVKERLGSQHIHSGHQLVDCWEDNIGPETTGGCYANFKQQSGGNRDKLKTIEADLIIACDGVHSRVRKILEGENFSPPVWSGITLYRGTTLTKPYFTGRSMTISGHLEKKFVLYPISKEAEDKGQSLLNWVCLLKTNNEGDSYDGGKERWNVEASKNDVAEEFSDFDLGFVNVPELIRGAEAVYKYPMVSRKPMDSWVHGRITLLGDAAHPMWPVGSNGATQSILDTRVLARCLAVEANITSALESYDMERRKTTAAIARANQVASESRFLEIINEKAPEGFDDLSTIISKEELEEISSTYKTLAGFSPGKLNIAPSLMADCLRAADNNGWTVDA